MINSRDSYIEYNPNKKETIEVPYHIGTILELKENPLVLARICQYRIGLDQELKVGLNQSIDLLYDDNSNEISQSPFKIPQRFVAVDFSDSLDIEITTQELQEKWQKTQKIVIGKIDYDDHKKTYTRSKQKRIINN